MGDRAMIVGVPKETFPGELRVAMVPSVLPSLKKGGMDVLIESNAGEDSGYPDSAYIEKGRQDCLVSCSGVRGSRLHRPGPIAGGESGGRQGRLGTL